MMMADQEVTTLAYSKSPKTSKRTTFQDELQAAVSSRASRTKPEQLSNYMNIDDEEDDFLNKLLSSRRKRMDAFKAGKSKAKLNTFDLSDDEENRRSRPKKVSFLKSQRSSSDPKDTAAPESHENGPLESPADPPGNDDASFSSQRSTNASEGNTQFKDESAEHTGPQLTGETLSLSYQTSDDALPPAQPSDGGVEEAPGPTEQKRSSGLGETFEVSPAPPLSNTNSAEREPPVPKPRQRTLGLKPPVTEKPAKGTASQDSERPQVSPVSAPVSADTPSNGVCSGGDHAASSGLGRSSSYESEQSQLLTKSTVDSGSRGVFISNDSKEVEKNYSSSFEEFNGCSGDTSNQASHTPDKSLDTRTSTPHSKTSERSRSVCSKKVDSKYLGTLRVLDRKVSLQESQPQSAESLRAAVYQEWLKKKREKSRENLQLKKEEQLLKEKAQQEQESKREDVAASYEAWREKKAESLRAKARERNEKIRKEQKATEEKQEKRQSAEQVFEQWKQERDRLLREKHRKHKEAKNKLQLQKRERDDERKKNSKSAFSDWCEKKKDVLHEKLERERKQIQTKAEEEQYMKEDRDKMALDTYESWLTRKDREQRRRRGERQIRAIIGDSPPPPWSPPNKTVPFGK
ncbi:microtubule-associated protein 9 isoform X2 [Kryptolebias marmoratus]|uniref:microtubule-associated protein 9 isoform X2 n=1 Tax=Kryptolebias marmoratus TaxID=37003 RepID=UPI0007F8CA57|nr:microtubule-associated protein 9 isoform X2 [Kryptolebias marmoratus]